MDRDAERMGEKRNAYRTLVRKSEGKKEAIRKTKT
jgi:hypothetical protein